MKTVSFFLCVKFAKHGVTQSGTPQVPHWTFDLLLFCLMLHSLHWCCTACTCGSCRVSVAYVHQRMLFGCSLELPCSSSLLCGWDIYPQNLTVAVAFWKQMCQAALSAAELPCLAGRAQLQGWLHCVVHEHWPWLCRTRSRRSGATIS